MVIKPVEQITDKDGKPTGKYAEPEWHVVKSSVKKVMKTDYYVLGHPDIRMPAVVSKSSLKGVKARLVQKDLESKDGIKVITEWSFARDGQARPVHFEAPRRFEKDIWVEALNPSLDEEARVTALVHGMVRGKQA